MIFKKGVKFLALRSPGIDDLPKREYTIPKRRPPLEPIINQKKERVKLTPEQLFEVYLECNAPGAPVKTILERYGLRP